MHRSVLEDEDFIEWANENIVVVVGNDNGSGKHEGKKKDDDAKKDDDKKHMPAPDEEEPAEDGGEGKKEEGEPAPDGRVSPAADVDCTYYPGIKCAEHVKVRQDIHTPPGEEPKIPEFKAIPASFLVGPEGTVKDVGDARATSSVKNAVEDLQKELKAKPLPFKKYEGYLKALDDGDKAAEEGKWKAALAAYGKIDKDSKKVPGLAGRLPKRLETLNAKVVEAFEKAKGEADAAAKVKAVKALRAEASAKLSSGPLPVVAEMDAWIKENPVPPAPKK
jgi:hypothetical protein